MKLAGGPMWRLDTLDLIRISPVVVTGLLWLTGRQPVSLLQAAAAFILLCIPCWSYVLWRKSGRDVLPVYSLISGMYWLYFALPLFWGDRRALDWRNPWRTVGDAAVTQSLFLVLLGLTAMWAGMRVGFGRAIVTWRNPEIPNTQASWTYLRWVLVGGAALSLVPASGAGAAGSYRQILVLLQTFLPMVALVIFFRQYLRGTLRKGDKVLLATFLGFEVLYGISSGWLGSVVMLVLTCVLVYLGERRKIPLALAVIVLPYVLFFQAGKQDFRRVYWNQSQSASRVQRTAYWVDASANRWSEALRDPSGERMLSLVTQVLMRASLLTQSANVIEKTPSVVPYQHGKLYSYFAMTLIPRFLWPEKPSMNEANQFYQVAYGVTSSENLKQISVAMGTLTEAYVNFGWPGAAVVMFLLGMLLDLFRTLFLSRNSGLLYYAIGIALVPQLLILEEQLAQYLGGVVQHIGLALLVYLPIVILPSRLHRRGPALAHGRRAALQPRWRSL